jgi:vacuolar-type H+-ATPase subunit I/STV1
MADQSGQEKYEKGLEMDEKTEEKQHEKMDEKTWEEKHRSDPLSRVIWAGILIWAGVVLLANNLGILRDVPLLGGMDAWSLAFAGAGLIILVEVLIRLVVPAYSGPVIGSLIIALVLLGIGLDDLVGWSIVWPAIVIGVGVVILFRALFRKE